VIDQIGSRYSAAALFGAVETVDLPSLCTAIAALLKRPASPEPWIMLPPLLSCLSDALERAGTTAPEALARHADTPPMGQLMSAVSDLARYAGDSTSTGSGSGSGSGASAEGGALRRALERVAANPAASSAMRSMQALSSEQGSDGALLAAAQSAESEATFGADVAFILHQENLDRLTTAGASAQIPPAVTRAYQLFHELRPRLEAARARVFYSVVPRALDAQALVKAVVTRSLTVEALVGTAKDPEARLHALARVWPVLMVMMRLFHPRDTSTELTFLQISHELLDVGSRSAKTAIAVVVEQVLKLMKQRFSEYLRGVGSLPAWSAVRQAALEENARILAIEGQSPAADARAEAQRLAREKAKAEKEAKAAAEAAASGAAAAAAAKAAEEGASTPKKKGGPGADK
jgi:hypothetical protein